MRACVFSHSIFSRRATKITYNHVTNRGVGVFASIYIYYSQKVKGQLHFVGMEDKVKLVANKKQLE